MRRNRGFVLPLVLIFLLIGGALTFASLDLAAKSQNSSMNMITTQELYNAAQSGIEWGKVALLEHREDLDVAPEDKYVAGSNNLAVIYATYDDDGDAGTDSLLVWDDEASQELNGRYEDSNIAVEVEIFNCNYQVEDAHSRDISADDKLPPVMRPTSTGGGSGSGKNGSESSGSGGSESAFTEGTTVIMDGYRIPPGVGGGDGYTSYYFVIRAEAKDLSGSGRSKTLETMVEVRR